MNNKSLKKKTTKQILLKKSIQEKSGALVDRLKDYEQQVPEEENYEANFIEEKHTGKIRSVSRQAETKF